MSTDHSGDNNALLNKRKQKPYRNNIGRENTYSRVETVKLDRNEPNRSNNLVKNRPLGQLKLPPIATARTLTEFSNNNRKRPQIFPPVDSRPIAETNERSATQLRNSQPDRESSINRHVPSIKPRRNLTSIGNESQLIDRDSTTNGPSTEDHMVRQSSPTDSMFAAQLQFGEDENEEYDDQQTIEQTYRSSSSSSESSDDESTSGMSMIRAIFVLLFRPQENDDNDEITENSSDLPGDNQLPESPTISRENSSDLNESESQTCPICLSKARNASFRVFPCGHAICDKCLNKMVKIEAKKYLNPNCANLPLSCCECRNPCTYQEILNFN